MTLRDLPNQSSATCKLASTSDGTSTAQFSPGCQDFSTPFLSFTTYLYSLFSLWQSQLPRLTVVQGKELGVVSRGRFQTGLMAKFLLTQQAPSTSSKLSRVMHMETRPYPGGRGTSAAHRSPSFHFRGRLLLGFHEPSSCPSPLTLKDSPNWTERGIVNTTLFRVELEDEA